MAWSTTWTLPNPIDNSSMQIKCTEADLEHASRHFLAPDEPWADFLTAPLLERLRACWQQDPSERAAVLAEVAAKLNESLNAALKQPMVCQYTQLDFNRYEMHKTWEVATEAGFLLIVRHENNGSRIVTAFYPIPVCTMKASKRWKETAKWVVRIEYPCWDEAGQFVLPSADNEFDSYEAGNHVGYRVDLTYITPERWGFRDGIWRGGPLPWAK